MINSDQVNYIVWRYLCESGFDHAAFSLKNEMRNIEALDQSWATRVPTGHLVDSLQRALMFEECLAQIDEEGGDRPRIEEAPSTTSLIPTNGSTDHNGTSKRKVDGTEKSDRKRKSPAPAASGNNGVDSAMPDATPVGPPAEDVPKSITETRYLEGHTSGLDQVAWSPTEADTLATTSTDGTVRIWHVPQRIAQLDSSIVLSCLPSRTVDKSVTAIAWNVSGQSIVTGSYDGVIRLFARNGQKQHRDFSFHTGPIFALKFSRRGDYILSASADGFIGVWNVNGGNMTQRWDLKAPVMDIEWISDALFLSSCQDGTLKMWQLGRDVQVKQFMGHKNEISILKWNSNINLGATAGLDREVKVWRADSEKPTQVLLRHKKQVHALEWAPRNQGDYRILSSASRDGVVCVWDVVRGDLLHCFVHDRPILALTFSANNLLASAGEQGEVVVCETINGKILASQKMEDTGLVFNMRFSPEGDRIALSGSSKRGLVMNLPDIPGLRKYIGV